MGSVLDVSFTMVIDAYKEVRKFCFPFRNLPDSWPWYLSTDLVVYGQAVAESFVFITFIRNGVTLGLPFGLVSWLNDMSLTHVGVISGCVSTGIGLLCIPMAIWGKQFRIASIERYEKVARLSSDMDG